MNSWGQSQSGQQGAATGMLLIPEEGGDNLLRRSFLEFPDDADGFLRGLRLNEQVEVFGHQYPAQEEKAGFLANLAQSFDERPAETLAREEPVTPIGAGGDELHLAMWKMPSVNRHMTDIGGGGQERESQGFALRQPYLADAVRHRLGRRRAALALRQPF